MITSIIFFQKASIVLNVKVVLNVIFKYGDAKVEQHLELTSCFKPSHAQNEISRFDDFVVEHSIVGVFW